MVKKFAGVWKPDRIYDLGDLIDWSFISSYDKEYLRKLEGRRFMMEYQFAREDLFELRELADELVLLEGNHDDRMNKYIDANPMSSGYLEYEIGLDISGLDADFIRLEYQPYKVGKLYFAHGWWINKYYSLKHMEAVNGNIMVGHKHRFQMMSSTLYDQGRTITGWGVASLSGKEPDYAKGKPTGFQNGFMIVYMDEEGNFTATPVLIDNGMFIAEGEKYTRAELEKRVARSE